MEESEFFIDETDINYENIMNVVSGRISDKRLKKVLNHLDYTEISDEEPEEIEEQDDFVEL